MEERRRHRTETALLTALLAGQVASAQLAFSPMALAAQATQAAPANRPAPTTQPAATNPPPPEAEPSVLLQPHLSLDSSSKSPPEAQSEKTPETSTDHEKKAPKQRKLGLPKTLGMPRLLKKTAPSKDAKAVDKPKGETEDTANGAADAKAPPKPEIIPVFSSPSTIQLNKLINEVVLQALAEPPKKILLKPTKPGEPPKKRVLPQMSVEAMMSSTARVAAVTSLTQTALAVGIDDKEQSTEATNSSLSELKSLISDEMATKYHAQLIQILHSIPARPTSFKRPIWNSEEHDKKLAELIDNSHKIHTDPNEFASIDEQIRTSVDNYQYAVTTQNHSLLAFSHAVIAGLTDDEIAERVLQTKAYADNPVVAPKEPMIDDE